MTGLPVHHQHPEFTQTHGFISWYKTHLLINSKVKSQSSAYTFLFRWWIAYFVKCLLGFFYSENFVSYCTWQYKNKCFTCWKLLPNLINFHNSILCTDLITGLVPVVMYGCESWTVVLEKTLESPLDCKEIQPVYPKGDQSWVFIGRSDVEAETPILWPPDVKSWLTGKDSDAGND